MNAMKTEIAFWDTSAILPLCCSQIFTTQSKKWLRKYPKIVVWWETSVEINSGLARLKRNGDLTEKEVVKALRLWEKLRKTCRIVSPVEELSNWQMIYPKIMVCGLWIRFNSRRHSFGVRKNRAAVRLLRLMNVWQLPPRKPVLPKFY